MKAMAIVIILLGVVAVVFGAVFIPADPLQLTYAQALNLENYLYLDVVAFGLTQSVTASGVFIVVTGLALGGTGMVLYRLGQRVS